MTKSSLLSVLALSVLTGNLVAAVAAAETRTVAGTVTSVAGPVTVARASLDPQPLRFRDDLFWRDVVEAGKGGVARVLLGGKTTVTVRELSRLELQVERLPNGIRYAAELLSGKVRASVARMLMRPGDQVEIRTRNVVASVRGTDFIVQTVERPVPRQAFGVLEVRKIAQRLGGSRAGSRETVVVALSGLVEVWNRLSGPGRAERIKAFEAVRVSGRRAPARFQVSAEDLKRYLRGLTLSRPEQVRGGDKAEAVGTKVETLALGSSAQSVGVSLERVTAAGAHALPKGRVLSPTTTRVIARPNGAPPPPAAPPAAAPPPPPLPLPLHRHDDD